MTKKYQTSRPMTSAELRHALPETVSVAMAEIIENVQKGLLAMAVGTGLQVMQSIMEQDVIAECGPKGKHDPTRTAVRHGSERGSVTLGGRRVPVSRPRMRAADGTAEVPVPAYELFSQTEVLGRMAIGPDAERVVHRRYLIGLEPVGQKGRGVGSLDEQVRGLAPVRRCDRDRSGRVAVGGAVRTGPGDVDDRRAVEDPSGYLAWLLTSGLTLWVPTAEERDARFLEVYPPQAARSFLGGLEGVEVA